MITYRELRFGNAFSYGPKNVLRLDSSSLTQLVGKNGFGKSSIALILEEVQFNTNSKGIKKGNILNRYSKEKSYWIELDFEKDGVSYAIRTSRTNTTSTVTLIGNGVDISSHTATATYKQIEEILGYDHKTFAQIVYQSSVASLEFLTATDTARKKFLIELLNLTSYTNANTLFKELASAISKTVDIESAKVKTISDWLTKYAKEDLTPTTLVSEDMPPTELIAKATELQTKFTNAAATNKTIETNNTYKKMLDSIVLEPWSGPKPDQDAYFQYKHDLLTAQRRLKEGKAIASKGTCRILKCPTCSQDIDNSTHFSMAEQFKVTELELTKEISSLSSKIVAYEQLLKVYESSLSKATEFEKYQALYNPKLPVDLLDEKTMVAEFRAIKAEILKIQDSIDTAKAFNKKALERNAKIEVMSYQISDMRAEVEEHSKKLSEAMSDLSNMQVLVKSFSTTGLLAYKIECLVKDLEDITNEYLAEMADGRFQLSFQISSSDKLNVVITDNGNETDLNALSMGEKARVNISALLAIRKLMQSLSNSRTNLLFLDETISNLDADGKDKLVEVLLAEESLNTFIVSHDFTHPLLEKINVVKDNNISRLE